MPVKDYLTHPKNELPKNWNTADFSDTILHQRVDVGNVKKQNYMESGKFPIIDQGQEYIAGYSNDETLVYDGELPIIIFGDHTRIFKFIDFPFICGADGTKVLQPNQEIINPEYFYFALKVLDIPSKGYNRHYRLLKEQKIPVPPLPEQRAIAHVLNTVRQAIEAIEGVIAAARELKRSMMKHLFTYGPVPVHEADQVPLKDTEIGEVPEGWEVEKLGDVSYKPQYGYTESATTEEVGPHFLRITDIKDNGLVNWSTVPYCPCSDENFLKYALNKDDILVARIGATTGKSYIVSECPPAVFASYLIRIKTKPSSLLSTFMHQFMNTQLYWAQINATKGGRLKQGVNISNLQNLQVPLPELREQKAIVSFLKCIDEKKHNETQRKYVFETLFNSLLHHLMTGEVRVKL